MIDTDIINAGKNLAMLILDDDVVEYWWFRLGKCRVNIWDDTSWVPTHSITVCVNERGGVVAATDFNAFAQILKLAKPSLRDLCRNYAMLEAILPPGHIMLPREEDEFFDESTGNCPLPTIINKSFVFFCNSFSTSRVLKVECTPNYEVTGTDIQEGVRGSLL